MFGRGTFKRRLPPGGYAWTGSDALTDTCPGCGEYSEIKIDEVGNWLCADCCPARTDQKGG